MPLPPDYWLPNGLAGDMPARPNALLEADFVWDIGAGVRPMRWYTPKRQVCIEPYGPYADRLEAAGYTVIRRTAADAFQSRKAKIGAIYLLDVIEHMEKDEAQAVIDKARSLVTTQLMIYTPMGFMEQSEDNWGLGGEYWQTHRSGWTPDDFEGWAIQKYTRGFFASWTPTAS